MVQQEVKPWNLILYKNGVNNRLTKSFSQAKKIQYSSVNKVVV
jgi:hypothetical protein